jgi:hypothetical protein
MTDYTDKILCALGCRGLSLNRTSIKFALFNKSYYFNYQA